MYLNPLLSPRVSRGLTEGTALCQFRLYQIDFFNHVVFTLEEFRYWVPGGDSRVAHTTSGIFMPTIFAIPSKWETHTVLLSLPSTQLIISSREANWERDLRKALSQSLQDLYADLPANIAARTSLTTFIGSAQSPTSAATGLFVIPPASQYNHFAFLSPHPFSHRGLVGAVQAVAAGVVVAAHRQTMDSTGGGRAPRVRLGSP